jgi:hypothetical protein
MTDKHNPYNPENYNALEFEIFYYANHETKELIASHKVDKFGGNYVLNNPPEDYPDDKYEELSQYSPKIKGYTII